MTNLSTRLSDPPSLTGPARVLLLLLGFTFVGLFLPWQQTVQGYGKVQAYEPGARKTKIEAPIYGRIVKWHVADGVQIRAGDPIVELSDVAPDYVIQLQTTQRAAEARIEAAKQEIEALRLQSSAQSRAVDLAVQAAGLKLTMAKQKVQAARQSLAAEQAAFETSRLNRNRKRALFKDGLVSQRDLELANFSYAKSEAALNKAQAAVLEAEANQTAASAEQMQKRADGQAKIAELDAKIQGATSKQQYAQAELAKVNVDVARQDSRIVTAPRDGMVVPIMGSELGEVVKQGDILATLIPDIGEPAVEIYVSGNDVPLMRTGDEVRLQFEGWPALVVSGWPSATQGTFEGRIQTIDAFARDNGRFRALVRPVNGKPWPEQPLLRQGLQAKAWVPVGQVALGWELWRLANGFPIEQRPNAKDKPSVKKTKKLL